MSAVAARSLLEERETRFPLDLGIRLVGVGAGPVGPHPCFVARQTALQASEPGIGEQLIERLEAVLLELQRDDAALAGGLRRHLPEVRFERLQGLRLRGVLG